MNLTILTDIHGCYQTMLALLDKCPKGREVVFLGDLVDRGPRSKEVVEYAITNGIPTVAGNHEDLMLSHFGLTDSPYDAGLWLVNGGGAALKSWDGYVPEPVRQWVKNLPLFIERDGLILSHTGHGKGGDRMSALWCRDIAFPQDGLFRVFGHTPSAHCLLGPGFARIDTGAAYKANGLGTMSAFLWPEREVIQQPFID